MSDEPEIELTGFQLFADFKPSRPKVLRSLTALLNELELHRPIQPITFRLL